MADLRDIVDQFITGLDGQTRRVSDDEWGISIEDVGGMPMDVGVAIREGLWRAQAWVAPAGSVEPHQLLFWNRQVPLVRFTHSRDGDVHVQVELPPTAVTAKELDRVLGLLVRVAAEARELLRAQSAERRAQN